MLKFNFFLLSFLWKYTTFDYRFCCFWPIITGPRQQTSRKKSPSFIINSSSSCSNCTTFSMISNTAWHCLEWIHQQLNFNLSLWNKANGSDWSAFEIWSNDDAQFFVAVLLPGKSLQIKRQHVQARRTQAEQGIRKSVTTAILLSLRLVQCNQIRLLATFCLASVQLSRRHCQQCRTPTTAGHHQSARIWTTISGVIRLRWGGQAIRFGMWSIRRSRTEILLEKEWSRFWLRGLRQTHFATATSR